MNIFQLEIVTPESNIYRGRVVSVTVPGLQGKFQVLANHAPIISTLGEGKLEFEEEGGNKKDYYAKGGVIEVLFNKAVILVEQILQQTESEPSEA